MPTNCIADLLSSVIPGLEVTFQNLTMVPLLANRETNREPRSANREYAVLDDALASGFIEITEVSEQGSVANLKVMKGGPEPVLIIDGEELVGAKQNRVVNLTILVAAQSALTIPVSCVEAYGEGVQWTVQERIESRAARTIQACPLNEGWRLWDMFGIHQHDFRWLTPDQRDRCSVARNVIPRKYLALLTLEWEIAPDDAPPQADAGGIRRARLEESREISTSSPRRDVNQQPRCPRRCGRGQEVRTGPLRPRVEDLRGWRACGKGRRVRVLAWVRRWRSACSRPNRF